MSNHQPTAMALRDGFAVQAGGGLSKSFVQTGQRFYGIWMQDGRFYFPMTQPDGSIVVCVGGVFEFGPIIEE
jgi:hypothetical protein